MEMRSARGLACLLAAALVPALVACGNDDPAEGLLGNVDKARTAASVASLQAGLATAAAVQADSPAASGGSLAAALQAKDAAHRYTTAAPGQPGVVQVAGGGGGPVMLVAINSDPSAGREPYYVAVWQGEGGTLYYVGRDAPAYAADAPAGPGWGAALPQ
jgi:hypothetical protein